MSIILDALKKAEGIEGPEADRMTPLGLPTERPAATGILRSRTTLMSGLVLVGVVFGIALGGAMAGKQWTGDAGVDRPKSAAAVPVKDPIGLSADPANKGSGASSAFLADPQLAARPERGSGDGADIAALYRSARTSDQGVKAPDQSEQPEDEPKLVRTKQGESVAVTQSEPDVEQALNVSGAREQTIDIEAVLKRAERALGEKMLVDHPVPLLENLSQQQKDRIPSILYSQHDWQAEQPAVVLNGQRVQAGQRVDGLVVTEILPDSVVLRWRETDFRLRSLNSWINL
jgi:hypothetical protein